MFNDILLNNNLTISACTKKTGIPKSTLADLAKGETNVDNMSAGNLLKLSQSFGVTMEEMLYYCKLPGIADAEEYRAKEATRVESIGLEMYVAIIQKTRIMNACFCLNDMLRFSVYFDSVKKYYESKDLPLPREYEKYTK